MSSLRMLDSPSKGSAVKDAYGASRGGIGSMNAIAAAIALNAVPLNKLNANEGVAGLDASGKILNSVVPFGEAGTISIQGPTQVIAKSVTAYSITNFDSFTEYHVSTENGGVSFDGETITYFAPEFPGEGGFYVNGRFYPVNVTGSIPNAPTLTIAQAVGAGFLIDVSVFGSPYVNSGSSALHLNTDWQIASDIAFSNIVQQSTADVANKTSKTFTGMAQLTQFYARARYRDTDNGVSGWSPIVSFTTIQGTPNAPDITSFNRSGLYFGAGQTASYTVNVSGSSVGPFTYTWRAFNRINSVNTVIRTITTANRSDSASVNVDDYIDAMISVEVSNAGGVDSDSTDLFKVIPSNPYVVAKNSYGNPGDSGLSTVTYSAQYYIGAGAGNAAFINALWPNGSGQDVYMNFQYANGGNLVTLADDPSFYNLITDLKVTIDGVDYTSGLHTFGLADGRLMFEPGLGNAIGHLYNLANSGKTVTFSYRFNGSAPITSSFTLNVFPAPTPSALEWSSGTNTGQTYGQLSVSSGLNYILRGNINVNNRARIEVAPQLVSGALPTGMSLAGVANYNNFRPSGAPSNNSSSHNITTGNPTTPGTYNFTVRLTWKIGDTLVASNDYPVTISVVA